MRLTARGLSVPLQLGGSFEGGTAATIPLHGGAGRACSMRRRSFNRRPSFAGIVRVSPQGDAELMAEKLGFKPAGRLNKSMTNIVSECRSANIVRDHADDSTRQCDPQPDGIFGKD